MKTFHRIKREIGVFILSKYQNKCSNCGNSDDLCVHHIIKMNHNDNQYNNIENLTVLCRSCHMAHHRKEKDIVPNNNPPVGNPYGRRGKMPPIKCSVEGCDNWQHGRALCKKHYEYKRKHKLL